MDNFEKWYKEYSQRRHLVSHPLTARDAWQEAKKQAHAEIVYLETVIENLGMSVASFTDGAEFGKTTTEKLIVGERERTDEAFGILIKYNRISNDLGAYLFDVAEWGMGKRDRPNPADFGIEQDTGEL